MKFVILLQRSRHQNPSTSPGPLSLEYDGKFNEGLVYVLVSLFFK